MCKDLLYIYIFIGFLTHTFIIDLHEGGLEHIVNILAILNQLEEVHKRAEDEAMARILRIGFAHKLQKKKLYQLEIWQLT